MEADRAKRRLAAIAAMDGVCYSRLVGADEEGTLVRLKALRCELVDPKIALYSGRIFKTTGDGLLLEFAGAVDAIMVEVQQEVTARRVACVWPIRPVGSRPGSPSPTARSF